MVVGVEDRRIVYCILYKVLHEVRFRQEQYTTKVRVKDGLCFALNFNVNIVCVK